MQWVWLPCDLVPAQSANYFMQSLPLKGLAFTKTLRMQAQSSDRGRWISNAHFFWLRQHFSKNGWKISKKHPLTTGAHPILFLDKWFVQIYLKVITVVTFWVELWSTMERWHVQMKIAKVIRTLHKLDNSWDATGCMDQYVTWEI